MTLPPPPSGNGGSPQYGGSPDPFGPPPQQPGAGSYGGPPQQGGPPQHHAPAWQPPQQQQPPHQQAPQQQPPSWAPQPGGQPPIPPRKRGNALKWSLGGVALLAIIGITATVSISLVKSDGDDSGNGNGMNPGTTQASGTSAPSPTPSGNSEIASANDTGPATIITEEPTCAAWTKIVENESSVQARVGWSDRNYNIPATEWTPDLREKYDAVSRAMADGADQTVALIKKTPHRLMRELYEQSIAYSRAFANSLSDYTAVDNHLADAAVQISAVALYVCEAIRFKSAEAGLPYVPDVSPPSEIAPPGDPNNPQVMLTSTDSDCSKWQSLTDNFAANTKAWGELDSNIAAADWNADQRAIVDSVKPVLLKYADDIESLGRSSSNHAIVDFAVFAAQYWRAYVGALPNYTRTDSYLGHVGGRLPGFIVNACQALGE